MIENSFSSCKHILPPSSKCWVYRCLPVHMTVIICISEGVWFPSHLIAKYNIKYYDVSLAINVIINPNNTVAVWSPPPLTFLFYLSCEPFFTYFPSLPCLYISLQTVQPTASVWLWYSRLFLHGSFIPNNIRIFPGHGPLHDSLSQLPQHITHCWTAVLILPNLCS